MAAKTAPVRSDAVNVERGDQYIGRGGRRVQIEAVYIDDAVPKVSAVELVGTVCDRPVLHVVGMCGCTPEWKPEGDPFTIVLTYRPLGGWFLPEWYEAV